MRKSKFMILGLGLTTIPVAFVPSIASCSASEVKVESISLECTGGHYVSEGTTYVLTNRSCSFQAKVLPENAINKNVTWSIEKPEGSTAEATVDENGNVKFTTVGAINLIATAKDGSEVVGKFENICGVNETDAEAVSKYYFCNDKWSEICDYANQGYDALLDHYAGLKTLTDPFVGLEREVLINGQKHIVRVIGEKHDTIAGTSNQAALTFELVTLLSDSDGAAVTSKWDLKNNYDYTNSILRWNLNGAGSGTKPSSGVWEKSALSMLPTELQNNIKIVNKKIATTSTYVVSDDGYNDKLFPLTYTEMAQSGSPYAKVEGSAYTYWINHNSSKERIKRDVKGKTKSYWLASPSTKFNCSAWCVDFGICSDTYQTTLTPVSFAFCI